MEPWPSWDQTGGGSHLEVLHTNQPSGPRKLLLILTSAVLARTTKVRISRSLGEVQRGMCKDVSEEHSWTRSQDNAGAGSLLENGSLVWPIPLVKPAPLAHFWAFAQALPAPGTASSALCSKLLLRRQDPDLPSPPSPCGRQPLSPKVPYSLIMDLLGQAVPVSPPGQNAFWKV